MPSKKYISVLPENVQKNIEDGETVWVNTNRLYEKMALAISGISDNNKREQVIKVQKKALAKMKTEREMFVPMTVGEVKISFGSNIAKLPLNTFRIAVQTESNNEVGDSNKMKKYSRISFRRMQQERLSYLNLVEETQE